MTLIFISPLLYQDKNRRIRYTPRMHPILGKVPDSRYMNRIFVNTPSTWGPAKTVLLLRVDK